jgi:hypothetical protein
MKFSKLYDIHQLSLQKCNNTKLEFISKLMMVNGLNPYVSSGGYGGGGAYCKEYPLKILGKNGIFEEHFLDLS